ncbi:hypothetical protein GF345_06645 [Candidatus Woesearchaeota archaeon]|nr:hypothetical protein [Candidatus Woesearchaeota archaeon]
MVRVFRSKKGQEGGGIELTDEWVLVVVLSVLIPLTAMIFVGFVTGYQIVSNSYLADVEDTIIQTRFLNNPDCFAYQDTDTGRIYPGVIDIRKFKQDVMDACYSVPEDYTSGFFRLELKKLDTEKEYVPVDSQNYGKQMMRQGTESENFFVLIMDNGRLDSGQLTIRSKRE